MDLSATVVIERAPGDVYGFVVDPANDRYWRSGVTDSGVSTSPPLGLGSEGFARAGETETRWRVVNFAEGSSVDWELLSGPYEGTDGYRIAPEGEHTPLHARGRHRAPGRNAPSPALFGRMGARQNEADVERLKELLDSAADT